MTQTAAFEDVLFSAGLPCFCYAPPLGCACSAYECLVRTVANGGYPMPLTPEQRAYMVNDAVYCGEGSVQREAAEAASDQDLAQQLLNAWKDYTSSQLG